MNHLPLQITGDVKIWSPTDGTIFYHDHNAIHYENFSLAIAQSLVNGGQGFVSEMVFGNGGTSIDNTGVITYLPTNTKGSNSSLYNQTYKKIVNQYQSSNTDATRNNIQVRHTPGQVYTDLFISCVLDYGEPSDQLAFDNSYLVNDTFVFDEMGIKSYAGTTTDDYGVTANPGMLLTHVIFHPIQKSLNRQIQVDYTIRIQSLTNLGVSA
jgi:hypothetical protein